MSCGVGYRHGSDLALLWLWCRPAATALTQPVAWEPLYATGVALKRQKKKKSERERKWYEYVGSGFYTPGTRVGFQLWQQRVIGRLWQIVHRLLGSETALHLNRSTVHRAS